MKVYQWFRNYLEEKKLWEIFIYLFFGGLATVVNIVSYQVAFSVFSLNWSIANVISWICSVLFAFVTNRLWVFNTHTKGLAVVGEFIKFIIARLVSFGMDMALMFLLIDILVANGLVAKVITQVVVVVANYVFSKVFIFKKVDVKKID